MAQYCFVFVIGVANLIEMSNSFNINVICLKLKKKYMYLYFPIKTRMLPLKKHQKVPILVGKKDGGL